MDLPPASEWRAQGFTECWSECGVPNYEVLRDRVLFRNPVQTAYDIIKEEPCDQQHENSSFKEQAGNHAGAVPDTQKQGTSQELRI